MLMWRVALQTRVQRRNVHLDSGTRCRRFVK